MESRIYRAILLMLILIGGLFPLHGAQVYDETGGLVIMEMENSESPLGLWQNRSFLAGYTGAGYLQLLGNTYETGPAVSPLEFTFRINQGGLYHLHLHAAKTNILEGTVVRTDVANDCYVRMEGEYEAGPAPYDSEGDNASLAVLSTDTKYYTYNEQATDKWKWENGTGNGFGSLDTSAGKRIALYNFKAGETYTLVVSGRSKYFRLNRIMFRHESVGISTAQNLSNPESNLVSGGNYTYDAITDFPDILSGDVPYHIDNGNDALAIAANIELNRVGFARAARTFDGASGYYDVRITTLTEVDGESTYRLLVNGSIVSPYRNSYIGPGSPLDMEPETHVWAENGFKVQSCTSLTNGVWSDVPGGDTPPVTVVPANPAAFYRLIELSSGKCV